MKKTIFLLVLSVLFGLIITGCPSEDVPIPVTDRDRTPCNPDALP